MAVLGLCCCVCGAFSSWGEPGLLFTALHRLLLAVASLVVERGFESADPVVVVCGLSCPAACGIFRDQRLNPCPLHWQANS